MSSLLWAGLRDELEIFFYVESFIQTLSKVVMETFCSSAGSYRTFAASFVRKKFIL